MKALRRRDELVPELALCIKMLCVHAKYMYTCTSPWDIFGFLFSVVSFVARVAVAQWSAFYYGAMLPGNQLPCP